MAWPFCLKICLWADFVYYFGKRRETIETGVSLGEEMHQERAMVAEKSEAALKAARVSKLTPFGRREAAARDRVRAPPREEAAKKAAAIVKEAKLAASKSGARPQSFPGRACWPQCQTPQKRLSMKKSMLKRRTAD